MWHQSKSLFYNHLEIFRKHKHWFQLVLTGCVSAVNNYGQGLKCFSVILEQRDRSQQRMDGRLLHFLLRKSDRGRVRAGWWEAAVTNLCSSSHFSFQKPSLNQIDSSEKKSAHMNSNKWFSCFHILYFILIMKKRNITFLPYSFHSQL